MHASITADIQLHLCLQSSLKSQMRNLTFAHISGFRHRHFPEAQHDFLKQHPNDFLGQTASDMQSEAFDQAAARQYMSRHKQPLKYVPGLPPSAEAKHERLTIQEQRQQKRQRQRAMPRHFFINGNYTTSLDQGTLACLQCHACSTCELACQFRLDACLLPCCW